MALLTFVFVGLMIWALPYMKWSTSDAGRSFFFKNFSTMFIIAICISALAYVISGFLCSTDACQEGLIAYSIFVDCVISLVWAIVLFSKEPGDNLKI